MINIVGYLYAKKKMIFFLFFWSGSLVARIHLNNALSYQLSYAHGTKMIFFYHSPLINSSIVVFYYTFLSIVVRLLHLSHEFINLFILFF